VIVIASDTAIFIMLISVRKYLVNYGLILEEPVTEQYHNIWA